jgi:hypothetical protein
MNIPGLSVENLAFPDRRSIVKNDVHLKNIVEEAKKINVDKVNFDKEDFQEKLQDFYMGEILKEYKYETVDTKLKTAFTREWNKIHEKEKKEKKTKKTKEKEDHENDDEEDNEEFNEEFQELNLEE